MVCDTHLNILKKIIPNSPMEDANMKRCLKSCEAANKHFKKHSSDCLLCKAQDTRTVRNAMKEIERLFPQNVEPVNPTTLSHIRAF